MHILSRFLHALSNIIVKRRQLIARKSMQEIQEEVETQNMLKRTLGYAHMIAIGLGSIIGMGILVSSGQAAAKYAGPSIIISFLLGGFVALLAALSFSEMSTMMPTCGSAYTYTYAALGEYVAWITAVNLTLLYQLAAITVVVGWKRSLIHLIEVISEHQVIQYIVNPIISWTEEQGFVFSSTSCDLPSIAISSAITIILLLGVRKTAIINLIIVIAKVLILLIIIFACVRDIHSNNYVPFFPPNEGSFNKYGLTGTLEASTHVFFSYLGFESVAALAMEAKTPARSLPVGIIGSLLISFPIYIGICAILVGVVPYKLLNTGNPLEEVIKRTPHGRWLEILLDLAGLISLTTTALALLLCQTRIFYAVANDGLLPPFFCKVYWRSKVPWVSILISGLLCALLSGLCPIDILGKTSSFSALIVYFLVHISVIVMRYSRQDKPKCFQVPFGRWPIPILGALLCVILMVTISKETVIQLSIWLGFGNIIYFMYGFWHSKKATVQMRNSSIEGVCPISMIDIPSRQGSTSTNSNKVVTCF